MANRVGIIAERKNKWEKRAPLTPQQAGSLTMGGVEIAVEKCDNRAFSDDLYDQSGATVLKDVSNEKIVLGIKEMPANFFKPGGVYIFFSHVHKGQKYNMPMLQRLLELKCTLIDYERIVDENGRRLIFFGRFAGVAGAVETLRTLGMRLAAEGIKTPFEKIKQPFEYEGLQKTKEALAEIGQLIRTRGLPNAITPVVFGVTGYGNVSRGVQEILDCLPVIRIAPSELHKLPWGSDGKTMFMSVFHEKDTVKPKDASREFNLQEYYDHPELYEGRFPEYVEELTVLLNCIYWEKKYPRLLTKEFARKHFQDEECRMKVIGDISADIRGGVEITSRFTTPDEPNYTYDPLTDTDEDGVSHKGPSLMVVDNLPCEIPRESSEEFGEVLIRFIPEIAAADYDADFADLKLPKEILRAVITHKGELTPDYRHLENFL